jgi:hypothetical protein
LYTEHITSGGTCIDGGAVDLLPHERGLEFVWRSSISGAARGYLQPGRNNR